MSGAPASQPVDPLLLVEHTRQTKAGPAHHLADHHDLTMAIVHRHHRHVEAPLHLPGGGAGNLPRGHRRGAIEELQGEMPHQPDKLQAHPLDLGTHRLPHRGRGHLRHLPGPGTRRLPHPGRERPPRRPDRGTHHLPHPGRGRHPHPHARNLVIVGVALRLQDRGQVAAERMTTIQRPHARRHHDRS